MCMVLAFSLGIFSSSRSLCFTGSQYPVLLINNDQFSQMPDGEKTFPGITQEFCPSPLEHPSPPARGVLHVEWGNSRGSRGEMAGHYVFTHPSVRGDLLFLIAPEGFLVISRTLCFSSWHQQLSPFITFVADSFQSAAPCSCLPKPIFSQLPEAA